MATITSSLSPQPWVRNLRGCYKGIIITFGKKEPAMKYASEYYC